MVQKEQLFATYNTIPVFAMDTNIFELHSCRVFLIEWLVNVYFLAFLLTFEAIKISLMSF